MARTFVIFTRFTFCGNLVANANPILGCCMAFVSATLLLLGDECKLWDSWQLQLAILEPSKSCLCAARRHVQEHFDSQEIACEVNESTQPKRAGVGHSDLAGR